VDEIFGLAAKVGERLKRVERVVSMSDKKVTLGFLSSVLLLGLSCNFLAPSSATPVIEPTSTSTTEPTSTPTAEPTKFPSTGALDLTIQYTGSWYQETFDYQPDSPNVRHMALLLPSDFTFEKNPVLIFTSLKFTPPPERLMFREDSTFYDPLLEYLHDMPQGHVVIELVPDTYQLAVAIILAALPPPDDDSLLYPGVTGGGISNNFQEVVIEVGETLEMTVELTDENGWG